MNSNVLIKHGIVGLDTVGHSDVFPVIYAEIFQGFCRYFSDDIPTATEEITKSIKSFFREYFQDTHTVLCQHENGAEYMTDVIVTSFCPKRLVAKQSLDVIADSLNVHLVAESELGGEGGSSAYGVMRNVAEDYVKLLIMQAKYRVLIFTSLPYKREEGTDYVLTRIETLRKIYTLHTGLTSGLLLIHLEGSQPKSSQVQASVARGSIRGFCISSDGTCTKELSIGVE